MLLPPLEFLNEDPDAPVEEVLRTGGSRTAVRSANGITHVTILEIAAFDPDPVYEVTHSSFVERRPGERRPLCNATTRHHLLPEALATMQQVHFDPPFDATDQIE
ncbi:hypothetical protein GE115_08970 [Agromyces sp. CFH 90414]|uniref:Uncharacterized protein n=1 Tax=Agromyces agglutinans TaxID=2662258 RepID=A0A6I2FGB2_9MICO|nr:hypothetical protein [Agromyces agglutinans]MRG59998.1 hypothetical protein [Agromyces agglutinans]